MLALQPIGQHRHDLRDLGGVDLADGDCGGDPNVFQIIVQSRFEDWNCRLGIAPEPSHWIDGGDPDDPPATDFVLPAEWMYQCNGGGARKPDNASVCRQYGAGSQ
jgi:hypothetical protein